MRNDLYVGAVISLGLHYVVASFNPTKIPPAAVAKEPEVIYTEWTVKPEDPVVQESVEEKLPKPVHDDVRPPSQPDVPQLAKPGSFNQPLQPSFDYNIDRTLVTIPTERTTRAGDPKEIFDLTKLDQPPIAKQQQKPVYPYELKKNGTEGEVLVDFVVDRNGNVLEAHAVRSTHREFEEAAVLAVSKWKFRAGRKAGVAVGTHLQVPIVFRLGESE